MEGQSSSGQWVGSSAGECSPHGYPRISRKPTCSPYSVDGLDSGSHSLVLGQAADDCGNSGISLDYITFTNSNSTSSATTWR